MTESLFDDNWLAQLASYQRLWVGFSGGLDSTVLLHHLAQYPALASKLFAVHIHHGLSAHADAWLEHCQTTCALLSIPLSARWVTFEKDFNIEEHARAARYDVFIDLLSDEDALVLAHHADDQAETLLLNVLRGAGIDGLAAMPAMKSLGLGQLLRPLLHCSRAALEAYAHFHQLTWIEDESNQDSVFSRNYLRHQVMPLLRDRWPGAINNLTRTAGHCQQAKMNLKALAELDCLDVTSSTLSLGSLQQHAPARLTNVLRVWLNNNRVKLPSAHTFNRIINEVICAREDAAPFVEWNGVSIRRYQQTLYLLKHQTMDCKTSMEWPQFPSKLPWHHQHLRATLVKNGLHVPPGSRVQIRFRQGGESFSWHGQTKALKKLLQAWHVPPWQRDTIPLVYVNDELVAVVGFAINDRFYKTDQAHTYHIEVSDS